MFESVLNMLRRFHVAYSYCWKVVTLRYSVLGKLIIVVCYEFQTHGIYVFLNASGNKNRIHLWHSRLQVYDPTYFSYLTQIFRSYRWIFITYLQVVHIRGRWRSVCDSVEGITWPHITGHALFMLSCLLSAPTLPKCLYNRPLLSHITLHSPPTLTLPGSVCLSPCLTVVHLSPLSTVNECHKIVEQNETDVV